MQSVARTLLSLLVVAAASAGAQQPSAAAPRTIIIRQGTQPPLTTQPMQGAAANNFTGAVRVAPVFQAIAPGVAQGTDVTFDAGARTAWHMHPSGQTLVVTAGVGRVQQWGGPLDEIRAGDVVRIPPGVKHWHGAAPDASMSHLGITELFEGRTTDWMEPVPDSQYRAPVRARPTVSPPK